LFSSALLILVAVRFHRRDGLAACLELLGGHHLLRIVPQRSGTTTLPVDGKEKVYGSVASTCRPGGALRDVAGVRTRDEQPPVEGGPSGVQFQHSLRGTVEDVPVVPGYCEVSRQADLGQLARHDRDLAGQLIN
jgi:hypothetical protein